MLDVVDEDEGNTSCFQLSAVTLSSLDTFSPFSSAWVTLILSLTASTSVCSLAFFSRYVVISASVLSLASPLATAVASRASCHSSEGQWSGQLNPGTHHLHAVPSHPPRSHFFYPAMPLIIFKLQPQPSHPAAATLPSPVCNHQPGPRRSSLQSLKAHH